MYNIVYIVPELKFYDAGINLQKQLRRLGIKGHVYKYTQDSVAVCPKTHQFFIEKAKALDYRWFVSLTQELSDKNEVLIKDLDKNGQETYIPYEEIAETIEEYIEYFPIETAKSAGQHVDGPLLGNVDKLYEKPIGEAKMNNTVYIVSNNRLNSFAKKFALTLKEAKIDCIHCGVSGLPLEKHRESAITKDYRFFVPLTDYYDTNIFRMEDLKTGCTDNYGSIDEIVREIKILVDREPLSEKELNELCTKDILKPEQVQIDDRIRIVYEDKGCKGKVKEIRFYEFVVVSIGRDRDNELWASPLEKYSEYGLDSAKEIRLLERPIKAPVKDKSYKEILEELYTLYNNFSSTDWNIETYREISNKTMKIIDQYKELE